MAEKKKKQQIIDAALADMKIGETRTVITGPGRQGRMMIKKGKGGPVGAPTLFSNTESPKTAKVIMGKNLPKPVGTKKFKSKIIKTKRYK